MCGGDGVWCECYGDGCRGGANSVWGRWGWGAVGGAGGGGVWGRRGG